jgi:hypothetical protein
MSIKNRINLHIPVVRSGNNKSAFQPMVMRADQPDKTLKTTRPLANFDEETPVVIVS